MKKKIYVAICEKCGSVIMETENKETALKCMKMSDCSACGGDLKVEERIPLPFKLWYVVAEYAIMRR